ncbi:MAG: glycosyltransferase family 4 protein [Eubacteriales bacterium]|nr:glycosyltransferase family 4 protein [Eubacteriales bacterium]
MKILLLSRYGRLGASSRVRSYQYIPYLELHGMKVTVGPLLEDAYIQDLYADKRKRVGAIFYAYLRRLGYLFRSHQFDLLWIEKELFPWLPALAETLLDHLSIPYVVDYDDAVFHRYDIHPKAIVRSILGRKIDAIMRRAAIVIVGNDYLAERARRAGAKRVEYLPTVVDLEGYHTTPKSNSTVFTIGWIGSPATCHYLKLIASPLRDICSVYNARLVLIGAEKVDLPGVPIEYVAWSEATEVQEMQRFDVGVMPLVDEPWERGKCGFKLIQYMACGRPVVGSPIGVNKQIIEHGVNGFQANTNKEWVDAMQLLRKDAELREKMGECGRKLVEESYCIQVTAPKLVSLLRSVVR